MSKTPNPGSDEAIKQGCKCPVLDNAHGKGYMCIPDVFVFNEDCPLHRPKTDPNQTATGFYKEEPMHEPDQARKRMKVDSDAS